MKSFSNKNKPQQMNVESGMLLIREVISKIGSTCYQGISINIQDLICVLGAAALEVRDTTHAGIIHSDHLCFYGMAGSGKTLLGQILIPAKVCSILTNDSCGVGQAALDCRDKCLKIDDAESAFFDNNLLVSTVKTMYHNVWAAKVHGAKATNPATLCFITTNNLDPIGAMSQHGGAQAYTRRFTMVEFKEKLHLDGKYQVISDDVTDEITMALCDMVLKDPIGS